MKSNHTYNHRYTGRTITTHHLDGIRQSVKQRRASGEEGADMKIGDHGANKGDNETLGAKVRSYMTDTDYLILWDARKGWEFSIEVAIKKLQWKVGRDLTSIKNDLYLFLLEYSKGLVELDVKYPMPAGEIWTEMGYEPRKEAMSKYKSEGIKTLEKMVEGVKVESVTT